MTTRPDDTGFRLNKWANNPIMYPKPGSYWEAAQVRNPAAIMIDGKVHLFYTATGDIEIEQKLWVGHAVSDDGYHFERVSEEPCVAPSADHFDGFDAGGVEDPRVVMIDGTLYMTYCARSVPHWLFLTGTRLENPPTPGVTWTENYRRGGLVSTTDLKTWKRWGPVTTDDHYDCNIILFPEKINGRFAMLHRPSKGKAEIEAGTTAARGDGMAICFSDDLKTWVDHQPLAGPEFWWEGGKIGGATPPIRTDQGWLTTYHSVEPRPEKTDWHPNHQFCYRTGVMMLDLDDPTKVIARCPHPILEPETPVEKYGTVNNVVFATGHVIMGDELLVYYGGADTVLCVATTKLQDLIDLVMKFPVKA